MCNGTFRLSFDGEMSSKLLSYSDISEVTSALRTISTIRRNAVSVATLDTGKVCEEGAYTNKSIIFEADFGNVPRLGLWNSIVGARNPFYYSTENSSNVLQLTTSDGRDDSVKLCNGIGKCNFFTGECTCPYVSESLDFLLLFIELYSCRIL